MVMHIFRDKKNIQIVYFAVAIAFVLSLGYAGITGQLTGPDRETLATVNGEPINYAEFQKGFEQQKEQYQSMFFKEGDIPEIYLKDIRKGVIQNLINQKLLLQYARKNGLSASDTEIKERIRGIFSADGKFNANYMKYALKEKKITEKELYKEIETYGTIVKIQQIVKDAAKVSDNEITEEYAFKNEQRKARYIKIDTATFGKQVKVSPEEISRYYTERKAEFILPEQLKVQYSMLDFNKEFEKSANEKALLVIAKLSGGTDFVSLVKEYSDDLSAKDNNGDLGFFKRGKMVSEFEKAAFALKPGEITKTPVKTQFGYHIIKIEERKGEEVRARHILIKPAPDAMGKAAAIEKLKQLKKDMTSGAKALGLVIKESSFSRSEYLNPKEIEPDEQEIVKSAVFKLKPGEISEPVETRKGLYVLKLISLVPESYKTLEMVKARIEDNLKKEKAAPLAELEAENIYKAITSNATTFDKACVKYGIKDTGYFSLTDKTIKGIDESEEFIKSIKTLRAKGEIAKIIKGASGIYLAQLADIKTPDLKTYEKEKEKIKTDILNKKQMSAFSGFLENLRKNAKIKDYSEKKLGEETTQP